MNSTTTATQIRTAHPGVDMDICAIDGALTLQFDDHQDIPRVLRTLTARGHDYEIHAPFDGNALVKVLDVDGPELAEAAKAVA